MHFFLLACIYEKFPQKGFDLYHSAIPILFDTILKKFLSFFMNKEKL